jgi:hypothetical protein
MQGRYMYGCRAVTCMGGVGTLGCLYRASGCSLPAMMNNAACYYYYIGIGDRLHVFFVFSHGNET